ncbi:hypothetical protein V6N13_126702 [Hibiscus sabdariffa]|uniref:Uncharacterized protein n=1 Tax=Hibiscus sabdariffa TaxID=183260 RepID=A0ABR2REP9_9ROSI
MPEFQSSCFPILEGSQVHMHAANSPIATILEEGSPVHMSVANSPVATVLEEGSQAQIPVANSPIVAGNPPIATVPLPKVVDNSGFPTYSHSEVDVPLEFVPTEDIADDLLTPGSHRESVIESHLQGMLIMLHQF